MDPSDLTQFIGRRGVYIEDGIFCVVQVTDVPFDKRLMSATISSCSDLIFRYEDKHFSHELCPFGNSWEIAQEWKFFYLEDDYWDGSLRQGFRLLFDSDIVSKFQQKDVTWIEDIF